MDLAVDEKEWEKTPRLQREAIQRVAPRLKIAPAGVGQRIPRAKWPQELSHFENLFRLPLPEGWRALYTVRVRKDVPAGVRIAFIGDHRRYDRLFGYKSR